MVTLVLLIISAVLHFLAGFGIPSKVGLSELGWGCFVLAFVFGFGGFK